MKARIDNPWVRRPLDADVYSVSHVDRKCAWNASICSASRLYSRNSAALRGGSCFGSSGSVADVEGEGEGEGEGGGAAPGEVDMARVVRG